MRLSFPVLLAGLMAVELSALGAGEVGRIKVSGVIGPATPGYVSRAVDLAAERHQACLIIQLDTPGGALDATREIVQKFFGSSVPIVVYVSPAGAWAGSAGCFITMAADVAAMAPGTSIGAAHPVSMLPGGGTESTNSVMKEKLENFASSWIASIAEKRHRNIEWAKSAVVTSQSVTASNALDLQVIDLVAADIPDLLEQLDGKEINGKELKTASAKVFDIPMTWREKTLQLISHPELLLFFMLVAMYGIIGELSHPGTILPGVAGAIALILALYLMAILPVNFAGLALMLVAVALFIIDVYAPTHGILTFGGIVAFFLGALMLFNGADPGFRISLAYIIPATAVTALFFIFVVGAGLRAQFLPVRSGKETMLGKRAGVVARVDETGGKVFVEGEYWNARSAVPVEAGQNAEIVGIEGLTLKVKPVA